MTQTIENTMRELSTADLEKLLADRKAEEVNKAKVARQNYEDLKAATVMELIPQAKALSEQLKAFKTKSFADMGALYDLLCTYSKRHADGKGSFSIELAEGLRITYKKQDVGFFDERSAQAERHIIDFVNSYYGHQDKTRKLVTSLLERKKGKLDIKLVQKLYAMENDFDDKNWVEGIKLLKESWTASESKSYITFEVKVKDTWESINLNFASI